MRFQGWYVRNKAALDGILDGGEFVQRPVSFRRR
jgi:hypothetical protein